MSGKKVVRAFGESFLRTVVIILALVIVAFAGFFVFKLLTTGKKMGGGVAQTPDNVISTDAGSIDSVDGADGETTEPSTEEATEEQIPSTDKTILVLNATSTKGLAGAWADKLKGSGFSKCYKGNYKAESLSDTKIFVSEEGMGNDLLEYFENATIVVGLPTDGISVSNDEISASSADIIIAIGSSDDIVGE